METTGQVTYDGDGWRLTPAGHWTQGQWRAACHFPMGMQPTSGLGQVAVVCGMGLPPEAAQCPDVRTAILHSMRDDELGGVKCKLDAWGQMTGVVSEGCPDTPGAAQGARYLTTPIIGLDYASTAGGKCLEWMLNGWCDRVDVLILPPSSGGDNARWLGAIRTAVESDTVLVGDWGWHFALPADATLFSPWPIRAVNGALSPIGTAHPSLRVVSVPVVVHGHTGRECDRRAVAMLGGLVLSSLGTVDGFTHDTMGRVRSVRHNLQEVHGQWLRSRRVDLPHGVRGFAVTHPPLRWPSVAADTYAGGVLMDAIERPAAAPPDMDDPRR